MKNKTLFNDELLRQVNLTRYQNGEIQKLLKLLESANKQIEKYIRASGGVTTKARYNQIKTALNQLSKELRENINSELDTTDLIENELNKQKEYLYKHGLDVSLPNEKMIRSAVQFQPFADSANYESFLESVETGFYNTWDNALRTGYMTGETTGKIISGVMGKVAKNSLPAEIGTIEKLRTSIERNTRTYLQSMASMARNELYRQNEKLFSGFEYVATLDRRTCLVCASFDGKIYKTLKQCPTVPVHYNCRCTIIPRMDDYTIDDDVRASEGGYVDAKTDFNEWLKGQSAAVQRQVLGAKRFELYKKNPEIDGFVNDGKVIALKDL